MFNWNVKIYLMVRNTKELFFHLRVYYIESLSNAPNVLLLFSSGANALRISRRERTETLTILGLEFATNSVFKYLTRTFIPRRFEDICATDIHFVEYVMCLRPKLEPYLPSIEDL